jgi:hypothetical protein
MPISSKLMNVSSYIRTLSARLVYHEVRVQFENRLSGSESFVHIRQSTRWSGSEAQPKQHQSCLHCSWTFCFQVVVGNRRSKMQTKTIRERILAEHIKKAWNTAKHFELLLMWMERGAIPFMLRFWLTFPWTFLPNSFGEFLACFHQIKVGWVW